MTDNPDPNNGKITMAILGERLASLACEVRAYNNRVQAILDKHETDISKLYGIAQTSTHRLNSHDGDLNRHNDCINDLEKKVDIEVKDINTGITNIHSKYNLWAGFNSALSITAGIVGSFFNINK